MHDGPYEHFLHDSSPIPRRYLRAMPVLQEKGRQTEASALPGDDLAHSDS